MCKDGQPSIQSVDVYDSLENLKFDHSVNSEAIRTLSETILQLTSMMAQFQSFMDKNQNKKNVHQGEVTRVEQMNITDETLEHGNHENSCKLNVSSNVPCVLSGSINPPLNNEISEDKANKTSVLNCETTKSAGPDMILNKILTIFAFEFALVITDIFNTSMKQEIFPNQLKRSSVVPIPKVLPRSSIEDDLRPTSLTAQVSKVMERFVLESLTSEVAHKLDPKQFALPTKSTTQALVYLLHLILPALDRGQCSIRIFFADFKKGFDLVDHTSSLMNSKNSKLTQQ